jgi:hypothetical protein
MSEQADIDTWLGYLEQVLSPLPAGERADIVFEARAFLEDHKLNTVAGQSLIAFLVFSVTTLGAIGCLLLKFAQPQMAGLWPGLESFALGGWTYPTLIAIAVIDAWLARFSLVLALKGIKGRSDRE